MAVSDLFKKLQLINKVPVSTPNGWIYQYQGGATFDGISLKKAISYQTQASLIGNNKTQYQLSTYKTNAQVLPTGQIYRWKENEFDADFKYAIVKNPDNASPVGSAIDNLQVFDAESFVMPDDAVVI